MVLDVEKRDGISESVNKRRNVTELAQMRCSMDRVGERDVVGQDDINGGKEFEVLLLVGWDISC